MDGTMLGKREKVRNAVLIGGLCSISYLAVYFARNILGAVTPQILEEGVFSTEFMGTVSSVYFFCYAVGQLINGVIGDKVKAKYMISFGLLLAGICNFAFVRLTAYPTAVCVAYGMTGFFLAMIYGPMTKVVAENTEPLYATRCSLGYTFASFLGSPLAGAIAAVLAWQKAFDISSMSLIIMGILCFATFLLLEKKGIVKYGQYVPVKEKGSGIRVLIRHKIIKFTLVSILTGVIRTSVVFWMPTYLSQYLGYSVEQSAFIYTVVTLIISFATFFAIAVYEALGRNMELTVLLFFILSVLGFLGVYLITQPTLNIILMIIAILAADSASAIMWSRYCPSLRDTGMVSSATGFLDFVSYIAAAVASAVFANAVEGIGWRMLILVWFALMAAGVIVSLPYRKFEKDN